MDCDPGEWLQWSKAAADMVCVGSPTLNPWPIILICFAVGGVVGFVAGYVYAVRSVERLIRGGQPRLEFEREPGWPHVWR